MAESLLEYEGVTVPSFMSTEGPASGFFDGLRLYGMTPGRVTAVYYPEGGSDKSKVSRSAFIEYDVQIEHTAPNGLVTRRIIPRARVMNLFGGVADFETWTPRPTEGNTASETELGLDSQVMVLCSGGNVNEAFIVGGIPHSRQKDKEKKEDGHHWIRQFNGARMEVNKDGELILSFAGATKADGSLIGDAGASGSKLTFMKDGSIKLGTKDNAQFIHVDHAGKKLSILADSDWAVKVNGTWNTEIGGQINVKSNTGGMKVDAPLLIHLNSTIGTQLGAGTNKMMMGTAYRTAEITMNSARLTGFTAMAAQFAAIGGALSAAGGTLMAVSALHKVPVAGAVTGSVPLQAAAAAIISAGGLLASLAATLSSTLVAPLATFEAGAPTYLSLKNSLD